jgi:hypothetical protein
MFRFSALLASLVVFAALLTVTSSQAAGTMGPMATTNNLTFSTAVGLPGITLPAGTYVFESGFGAVDRSIVRVLSSNRQKQFYVGFTVRHVRPNNVPKSSSLVLGEAAQGAVPPILVWYPIGSNSGHEFLYR